MLVVFCALTLRVELQAQPKIIENGNYLYDSFNPAARDFVFNAVSKGYLQYAPLCGGCHRRLLRQTLTQPQHRYGIKTYWLDADEPERTLPDESGEYHYHAGQDTEVGMAYPREHQRMASQGLQAAGHPLGDFIMLSRSAWAGSAGLGAAMWSGDIQSLFSVSAWCRARCCHDCEGGAAQASNKSGCRCLAGVGHSSQGGTECCHVWHLLVDD